MSSYRSAAATIVSAFGFGIALGCNGFLPGEVAPLEGPPPPVECTIPLATALIDQKGGELKVPAGSPLFGARLQIPPDALADAARITLFAGEEPKAQGSGVSQTLCVSISDQSEAAGPVALAKAAALILPYEAARVSHITTDLPKQLTIGEKSADTELPVPLPGLTVVDEPHHLLAAEIRHPGRYLAITRGVGSPPEGPNLDVLFVLDNSGSMIPKQRTIAKHFPNFFKKVTRYDSPAFKDCIDYHIGITTTDVGKTAAEPGDDGLLQTQSCRDRKNLGSTNAQGACNASCAQTTMPLSDKFITGNKTTPLAKKIEQEQQFVCRAIVGDAGSSEESPLESIHRTIERQRKTPDMVGVEPFLRAQGLTAFVILTDEDDCSIEPTKRGEFYTPTTGTCNRLDPGQPDCYSNTNLRCLGVSLKCDTGLLTTSGNKVGCMSRTGAGTTLKAPADYAKDVMNFITLSGGGNLGRTGKPGTLYLFGAWPLRDKATGFETKISFPLDITNPPPSNTLGTSAFCYDEPTLKTNEPIIGHEQVRLNEYAMAINATMTPMMRVPQVTAASICRQAEREALLDTLADDLNNAPRFCTKPLAP